MATLAGTTTNANTREHHEIHIKRGKEVKEEIGKRREIGDTETWTEAGVEVKDTKEKRKGIAIEAVIESIGVKNLIGDIMSMRTGRGGIDIERGLVLGESLETAQGHDQDLAIKGASGQVGLIWLHLVQWSFQELHYQVSWLECLKQCLVSYPEHFHLLGLNLEPLRLCLCKP